MSWQVFEKKHESQGVLFRVPDIHSGGRLRACSARPNGPARNAGPADVCSNFRANFHAADRTNSHIFA